MREFCIQDNEAGQRFDKYLKKLLSEAPGSFVYKMLRKKNITLNGKKADGTEKLAGGDLVRLFLADDTFEKFSGRDKVSARYESLKSLGEPEGTVSSPKEFPGDPEASYSASKCTLSGSEDTLNASKNALRCSEGTLSSSKSTLRESKAASTKKNPRTMHGTYESVLPVLYEDNDILIVNKPSGMLSQKAKPTDISANEYILHYLIAKGELTEETMQTFMPSICNRLDRNTSGILIAGKTLKGLQETADALKERTVLKYYRCIVKGELKEKAYIRGWLTKEERTNKVTVSKAAPKGKDAQPIETEYRPVHVKNGYTELEVHLITGRSHQIRAHLSSIGHPIIGDPKYGDQKVNAYFRRECKITSQMLHAYRIVLAGQREIVAPCGEEFVRVRKMLGF